MKKYKNHIFISVLILLVISISLFYYGIRNIAPYAIIKPYRSLNKELNNYLKENYTRFEVTTRDSIKLVGYFIKSKESVPKGTIIILHGIADSKSSQIGIAEFLSNNGFNSIIFDLRAHGESGGLYCTYGFYEKSDVSILVDYVQRNVSDLEQIGIMGTSLGGAIAIQALATDKRIKCGVIVSTFSSLNIISYEYMRRLLYIPFKTVSDIALEEASKIAKFPANEINPKEYARMIEQPTLMVHGNEDDRIDIKYGKEIFNNIKTDTKKFYEVKKANHVNINKKGGSKYRDEVANFFNNYLYSE